MKILVTLIILFAIDGCSMYVLEPGPVIIASVGKVWPKPKYERGCKIIHFIDPNNFKFLVIGKTCDILEQALDRYKEIMKLSVNSLIHDHTKDYDESKLIKQIVVNLTDPCEKYPQLNMDEWYNLDGIGRIYANSIWGILRALETFSQLVIPTNNGMLQIPAIRINDSPRFSHRGFMLDTASHYINIDTIMKILDGMAYNKLNVFHWHIIDDESFPYQSAKFPELSEKGAFSPSLIYTRENISNIIEYARLRGIRVIAEFNIPVHIKSWSYSHPELITGCGYKSKQFGTITPTSETAFTFLQALFGEVCDIFKDNFFHIGGNDVNLECLNSDNNTYEYAKLHAIKYIDIYHAFILRITNAIAKQNISVILWDEDILLTINLRKGSLVQVKLSNWKYALNSFTQSGFRAILSACWNLEEKLENDIWDSYRCEPHNFSGTDAQKKLVIGGEAYIWTEFLGNRNIIQAIFPKLSISAERLWSQQSVINVDDAKERLEEHICRMILRGIPAQPILGPGFCG